jgi:putative lipoic acid-binding regulatory protein
MVPPMDAQEHDRLRALLEATLTLPGPFFFSVITLNSGAAREALHAAVERGGAPVPADAWSERTSSGGRYRSHRVTIECRSADEILDLYARIRRVDGVVAVL